MDIMNLKTVVENQSQYNVVWHEPWVGIDATGANIHVDVRTTIPVEGAIAIQREILTNKNPELLKDMSTLHLLCDFMEVHWALVELK
tara:strand:+ start:2016 stop:2276 length:261 start_codon:yes stop_codon:yes gene_type:complete